MSLVTVTVEMGGGRCRHWALRILCFIANVDWKLLVLPHVSILVQDTWGTEIQNISLSTTIFTKDIL